MRIFTFILPIRVYGLLLSEFFITFVCYLVAITIGFRGDTSSYLREDSGLLRLVLVSFSMTLGIFLNDLYANTRVGSRVVLVLKLCNVIGIALIIQGLLAYVTSGLTLPRSVMLYGSLITFVALMTWRTFYSGYLFKIIGTQRVLFVGNDQLISEIASRISRRAELGLSVCGYLDDDGLDTEIAEPWIGKHLGSIDEFATVVERERPDRIVISAQNGTDFDVDVRALLKLTRAGVAIEDVRSTYESICARVSSRELRASQIIFRNELAPRRGSVALQSIYANLAGICGFVVALPLIILCAIAVKLSSKGPIFERDIRVGQHGIPFSLNRFRCHRLALDGPEESLSERLTAVGKWLQKLRLVHLPRIVNLLRGEITLVGPRPESPEFVEELSTYFAAYRQRHTVKPGLTGWSQINSNGVGETVDSLRQLEYDLYYTKHISLALDAYILLHGIRRLLPFAERQIP